MAEITGYSFYLADRSCHASLHPRTLLDPDGRKRFHEVHSSCEATE